MNRPKKLPIIEKIPKWPLKKIVNLSTTHEFHFDLGPKRYFDRRDPVIEVCATGGRGRGGVETKSSWYGLP